MKKQLLLLIVALLLVGLIAVYFLLPSQVTIARRLTLPVNQDALARLLTDRTKWEKWWPVQTAFRYDSLNFLPQQELLKTAIFTAPSADSTAKGQIHIINYKQDTSLVYLQLQFPPAGNPVERISRYFDGKEVESDMDAVLGRLKDHALKMEHLYGMKIRHEMVKDTTFVATRFESAGYPDAKTIYARLTELKNYIQQQGATPTGAPMLHAETLNGQQYKVMVAIPVNRLLQGNGRIEPKRMVQGNILVGEVRGGPATVQRAMQELKYFVEDHHLRSPAIPFESLVTDRLQEPDTTKWITRLYHPVF